MPSISAKQQDRLLEFSVAADGKAHVVHRAMQDVVIASEKDNTAPTTKKVLERIKEIRDEQKSSSLKTPTP